MVQFVLPTLLDQYILMLYNICSWPTEFSCHSWLFLSFLWEFSLDLFFDLCKPLAIASTPWSCKTKPCFQVQLDLDLIFGIYWYLGYIKNNQKLVFNPSALGWIPKLSKFVLLSLLTIHSVFSLAPPSKQSSIPYITHENSHFNQGIEISCGLRAE